MDIIQKKSKLKNMRTEVGRLFQYDLYTFNHSVRVAKIACIIAKSLNCNNNLINRIFVAALMHDIGKIFIPKYILNKPGLLTNKERTIIQTHTILGNILLSHFAEFSNIKHIVLHHHEQYDGQGYPCGLKKEEIPLESRIIMVADTFDAVTSHRAYHSAISVEKAISEINRQIYVMFDPNVVEHLNILFTRSSITPPDGWAQYSYLHHIHCWSNP